MVNESWLAKLPGRGKEMERWGQRTGTDFSDSDVDLDHAKKDLCGFESLLDNVTASFPLHQNHPSKHTPPSQKLKNVDFRHFWFWEAERRCCQNGRVLVVVSVSFLKLKEKP